MKRNKLIILICVAAVMVFIAVKTGNNRTANRIQDREMKEAFADLPVNDVTKLVITDAYRSIELVRSENGWRVPKAFGYPASFEKVKDALLNLSRIKGGQPRTLNPEQRANAKLIPPLTSGSAPASKGILVQAFTSGDAPSASLLIGSDRQNPGNTQMPAGKFISLDDGNTALITPQITTRLEGTDPSAWLDNEIASVTAASITNIRISVHGEKPIELYKDKSGSLAMDDLSRKETLDESKVRSARYVLSSLRFDEVADPSLEETVMGFGKPSVFEVSTEKNAVYTLTIGGTAEGSDNRYARISAEFTGTIPPQSESPEENADTARARKELQAAKEQVDKVNSLRNWTYILSPPKFNAAMYTRKDLVKKKTD